MRALDRLLTAYRATGADLPFGDPLAAHGVAMEGYFWRITEPVTGRVLIALIGVNRDRVGGHWATLGLAAHPAGFLRVEAFPEAYAAREGLGAGAGSAFVATADEVRVDWAMTPDCRSPSPIPCPGRGGSSAGRASSRRSRDSTSTGIPGCSAAPPAGTRGSGTRRGP